MADDHTLCVVCGRPKEPRQRVRCRSCQATRRADLERIRNRNRPNRKARYWHRHCDRCGSHYKTDKSRVLCDHCWSLKQAERGPVHGPFIKDIGPLHDVAHPERLVCQFCNLGFWYGHGRGRKYCSNVCENYGRGRASLFTPIIFGSCRRCGVTYCRRAEHNNGFCSQRCVERERKRADKYRRRAHNRAGENFTLREIAERDNWRCHICGGKVPDRKYAARDKDPTIDHLIPVADGGEHTRQNVALAHNRCNWERSNEGAAQLRLVG